MGGAEEESRLDWNMFGCSASFCIEFRFVTAAPLRERGREEGGRERGEKEVEVTTEHKHVSSLTLYKFQRPL